VLQLVEKCLGIILGAWRHASVWARLDAYVESVVGQFATSPEETAGSGGVPSYMRSTVSEQTVKRFHHLALDRFAAKH
jgi:hypothetical protein